MTHGKNGYLYRFEDYELASKYIEDIFENDDLANSLSQNARKEMLALHEGNDLYQRIVNIYHQIIEE